MRLITLIFLLLFFANTAYSQGKAFIYIEEEHSYPAEEHTKEAQKYYTWTFNGKPIKYKTGKYEIKVNGPGQFDTIQFQHIYRNSRYKSGRAHYDTTRKITLCKFRENHNYTLSQILGNFEIFSLDTFETKKTLTFKTINKPGADTLYLYTWTYQSIFSDTTITITSANDNMRQSFTENIWLTGNKRSYACYGPEPPDATIFRFSYLYLHAEKIEIEYDFATQRYEIKLIN